MGFDPVSMAAIGLIGGGISAAGQISAGNAKADRAAYQSQVAANNAAIAKQNAEWTERQGAAEETAQGMKTRSGVGRLKTAMASSGVDINSGSAPNVLKSAEALGELDTLTIRSNMARKVYGFKVDEESSQAQSQLLASEVGSDRLGGWLSGLGSMLSSASSVGGRYAKWQNTGAT